MSEEDLVDVRGLKKYFPLRGGLLSRNARSVKAVDDVSFTIRTGETLGLVGESGCGKTTTGRCLLHLTKPTQGYIYWKMPAEVRARLDSLEVRQADLVKEMERNTAPGLKERREEIDAALKEIRDRWSLEGRSPEELRLLRKNMQIVFQDPYSSLNPRMLIKDIVSEPLLIHGVASGAEVRERAKDLLEAVGLDPEHLYRFPHEFSGGQRQRIGVARALALNPELVVLDEPTSALDMSVQAQILNLLNDLQDRFGLTYLFISHDLSTIHYMCDRVNVMYLGTIVESAEKGELFNRPLHPYTQALLAAIPVPDPDVKRERTPLAGEIPSSVEPPTGCRFHTRCKRRQALCEIEKPPLMNIGDEHYVSCHFWDQS
jgi:oligopeptide/dipeptide ABC transporter ATP-binding protein